MIRSLFLITLFFSIVANAGVPNEHDLVDRLDKTHSGLSEGARFGRKFGMVFFTVFMAGGVLGIKLAKDVPTRQAFIFVTAVMGVNFVLEIPKSKYELNYEKYFEMPENSSVELHEKRVFGENKLEEFAKDARYHRRFFGFACIAEGVLVSAAFFAFPEPRQYWFLPVAALVGALGVNSLYDESGLETTWKKYQRYREGLEEEPKKTAWFEMPRVTPFVTQNGGGLALSAAFY